MQWTACLAIEIRDISHSDATELGKIEVRISDLQGVKGPHNLVDSTMERVLSLSQFDQPSQPPALVLREYSNHVRVEVRVLGAHRTEGQRGANQTRSIEGAQRLPTEVASHCKDSCGDAVARTKSPRLQLHLFGLLKVV